MTHLVSWWPPYGDTKLQWYQMKQFLRRPTSHFERDLLQLLDGSEKQWTGTCAGVWQALSCAFSSKQISSVGPLICWSCMCAHTKCWSCEPLYELLKLRTFVTFANVASNVNLAGRSGTLFLGGQSRVCCEIESFSFASNTRGKCSKRFLMAQAHKLCSLCAKYV